MIIGSNLCATQSGTTFMNCASIDNLTSGCFVCVTTNKVLVNAPFNPNRGLFSQTGDSTVVSGTTTETSLIDGGVGSLLVPANGFSIGDSFRGMMGGVLNAANNETIRIKIKSGSVILLDSGVQTLPTITNDIWSLNLDFTIRQIGTAGVASIMSVGNFHYVKASNSNIEGFAFETNNNTTFDTTISNTLDITVQWGSTNATNNIFSNIFTLNKTF
jgi:hypothetical protein